MCAFIEIDLHVVCIRISIATLGFIRDDRLLILRCNIRGLRKCGFQRLVPAHVCITIIGNHRRCRKGYFFFRIYPVDCRLCVLNDAMFSGKELDLNESTRYVRFIFARFLRHRIVTVIGIGGLVRGVCIIFCLDFRIPFIKGVTACYIVNLRSRQADFFILQNPIGACTFKSSAVRRECDLCVVLTILRILGENLGLIRGGNLRFFVKDIRQSLIPAGMDITVLGSNLRSGECNFLLRVDPVNGCFRIRNRAVFTGSKFYLYIAFRYVRFAFARFLGYNVLLSYRL